LLLPDAEISQISRPFSSFTVKWDGMIPEYLRTVADDL
jgi:hypothetical protein